jgi:ferric enterobactin receptor
MNRVRFVFLLLLTHISISLFSQTTITASFQNESLISVLEKISEQYHLKFSYDNQLLQKKYVSVNINCVTREQAINTILLGTGLNYEIIDDIIVIKPQQKNAVSFSEQKKVVVKGIIIDSLTSERLPFASIFEKKTGHCVLSNTDGYFCYTSSSDTILLDISYLGYKRKVIAINNTANLNLFKIQLIPIENQFKELVIVADRNKLINKEPEANHFSINPAKMIELPQIGERDLFRSIQMLPGVLATGESSSGISIRGSLSEQNLVIVDGFTLYHVDHFFGEFSALNPDIIKNVQVFKSGYEAKYGGRAAGMILITTKNGNINKPSCSVGINMLSSNFKAEIPVNKKISLLIAGRRSYTDIVKSNVYESIFKSIRSNKDETIMNFGGVYKSVSNYTTPNFFYYDFNMKLCYIPNDKNIITLSLYRDLDDFTIANKHIGSIYSSNTQSKTKWGNSGQSLKWSRRWSANFCNNISIGISEFSSTYGEKGSYSIFNLAPCGLYTDEQNKINDININFQNELWLSNKNKLEFGVQSVKHSINYKQAVDTVNFQKYTSAGSENSFYLQCKYNPVPNISILSGLRITNNSISKNIFLEPRLSAVYLFSDKISLNVSLSKHCQMINKGNCDNNMGSYRDFWFNSNDSLKTLTSTHYTIGSSILAGNVEFDVECYLIKFNNLTEIIQNSENDLLPIGKNITVGNGYSRGVDLYINKITGALNTWMSYSYCVSKNRFAKINNEKSYAADNDQRHEFKVANVFTYKCWTFSAVWMYGSGRPYSSSGSGFYITIPNGTNRYFIVDSIKNSLRLPDYHRLDISCTYTLKRSLYTARVGLSVINLYGRDNVKSLYSHLIKTYNNEGGYDYIVENSYTHSLGFTPNFFINIAF